MKTALKNTNWPRIATVIAAFIALQLLWRGLGVIAPSERFHASVPLLWLLDWYIFRRANKPINGKKLACGIGLAIAFAYSFHDLGRMQAAEFNAWVDWRETLVRMVLVASLFILYGCLCWLISSLLKLIPAARRKMEAPSGWWLRTLRVVLTLVLFGPYVFACFNVHRFKVQGPGTPSSAFKLPYEEVHFKSGDGLDVAAWYVPYKGSNKAVVVCHGVGANKNTFKGVLPFLHRAGFNVLMFDFRGHGESGGHTTTFGPNESRDVVAAVRYASKVRGCNEVIGYGFSMGGAALIQAIPQCPELSAVVVDSTFARFKPLVAQQFPMLPPALVNLAVGITSFYSKLEIGISIDDIEPRRYIGALGPRPILIIHGLGDNLIPVVQARANYAAASQPKKLWLVPGAGHCGCRQAGEEVYDQKVTAFLKSVRPIE